jgi:hypothetical protein
MVVSRTVVEVLRTTVDWARAFETKHTTHSVATSRCFSTDPPD